MGIQLSREENYANTSKDSKGRSYLLFSLDLPGFRRGFEPGKLLDQNIGGGGGKKAVFNIVAFVYREQHFLKQLMF